MDAPTPNPNRLRLTQAASYLDRAMDANSLHSLDSQQLFDRFIIIAAASALVSIAQSLERLAPVPDARPPMPPPPAPGAPDSMAHNKRNHR